MAVYQTTIKVRTWMSKYISGKCMGYDYLSIPYTKINYVCERDLWLQQRKGLLVTLNDYTSSYSDMLEVVKRPTLYKSRIKNIAIETFKSVKGLNPEYMGSLFSFSTTPYCTRGGSKLVQPKVNMISFGINSFAYQGSKIWNNFRKV